MYLNVPPTGIIIESVMNIVMEAFSKSVHERGAGCDAVRVKVLFRRLLWRQMITFQA